MIPSYPTIIHEIGSLFAIINAWADFLRIISLSARADNNSLRCETHSALRKLPSELGRRVLRVREKSSGGEVGGLVSHMFRNQIFIVRRDAQNSTCD